MNTGGEVFECEKLPDIDQAAIKKGKCPWCLQRLADDGVNDICPGCGDTFTGKLTIDD